MQSAHLKLSLEGMGMQKVYPVNMQMTVRAYLFPFDEGIKSPIRSIEINSMGTIGAEKCPCIVQVQCFAFDMVFTVSHKHLCQSSYLSSNKVFLIAFRSLLSHYVPFDHVLDLITWQHSLVVLL